MEKKIMDVATKTRTDALKAASKKVVHKTAEGTGELMVNKITDKFVKPKRVPDVNSSNVEKIVIQ